MDLSVVVPVFREAATIEELARRCSTAARATGLTFEVLLVDDASGDGSAEIVERLPASLQVRVLRLARNQGQFRATQAGFREAHGSILVVLDGDLQDPPEVIAELVARHLRSSASRGSRVTFAVKTERDDPGWFMLGHAVFRSVQRWVGVAPPEGAGSYCALDREVAQRVSQVRLEDPNLAWVIAALGYAGESMSYRKQRRVDGASRMGPLRLAREATTSLFLATPAGRYWLKRSLGSARRPSPRAEFMRRTDQEIRELLRDPRGPGPVVRETDLAGLPAPVARWLSSSGVVGSPRAESARLLQRGQLRASPKGPFMSAHADQYVRLPDPAFIWRVETKLFKLVSFTGRDRYSDGVGNMRIELASRIAIVDAHDAKIAQGALSRFLAEMVWYPSAALEPYVSWTHLGERQARATMAHAGLSVGADFAFDAQDRVVGITARRFLGGGEEATLQPWRVDCTSWRRFDAIEVPAAGTVSWDLPTGSFVYYRWEITQLEYDHPSPFATEAT